MDSNNSAPPLQQLLDQWGNPQGVLAILLLLGGDVVQKALAQTSGGTITPVCFSFGWAGYSIKALSSLTGDGRLLPEPDHHVKVYNLETGYVRENKNWVIGRLVRDNIIHLDNAKPLGNEALRISIYDAQPDTNNNAAFAGHDNALSSAIATTLLQLAVAYKPIHTTGDWTALTTLAAGTALALLTGSLPQWRAEKLACRRNSNKLIALTAGNGSRDIMLIRGNGHCLDLEDLATPELPRSARMWESLALSWLTHTTKDPNTGKPVHRALTVFGVPLGFGITVAATALQSLCWLALLVSVAGVRSNNWSLIAIGGLGMVQNLVVAGARRDPAMHGIPLKHVETIVSAKVMDGLMDVEVGYKNAGYALLEEFFPGYLRADETAWWDGETAAYDGKRMGQKEWRGVPRSVGVEVSEVGRDEMGEVEVGETKAAEKSDEEQEKSSEEEDKSSEGEEKSSEGEEKSSEEEETSFEEEKKPGIEGEAGEKKEKIEGEGEGEGAVKSRGGKKRGGKKGKKNPPRGLQVASSGYFDVLANAE
ncbi:hypothetical protein BU16DRAFT_618656 [Lophium mytilinum]|uniref:Uncharacterized protein n=1 Tax=Lophium mytilinum TaxID=390894 RepID=A0A6A6QR32_9PEZI|nr:hypothetical protein BU16DRAFT_618656 [Lophium mytilinum]